MALETVRGAGPAPRPTLHVLPPSHYCERAAWALDRVGIAYETRPWLVGLHSVLARRRGLPDTGLPILDTAAGPIQGSGAILDWTGMGGGDPALEHRFEAHVGPLVRRYLYAGTLDRADSNVRAVLCAGLSPGQAFSGRLAWPLLRRLMIAGMDVRPARLPELERALEAEITALDRRVSGRIPRVGETLGRADLTAASLLAPLAQPSVRPVYGRIRLPPRLAERVAAWNARPGLQWVRATYAAHRAHRAEML